MEQRRLRLGDIVDDYCPRERRVTNHAVVAMVDEDVKQTRCTTCDAEHVYKGGKAPRKKKAETTGTLYKQVLAGLSDQDTTISSTTEAPIVDQPEQERQAVEVVAEVEEAPPLGAGLDDDVEDEGEPSVDEGPVHRPLIRAQLPRIEGAKLERQAPDFTIRQASARGNAGFRGGHGQGGNNGHHFGRGPNRGGGRSGANQGFGRGTGGSQPRHGGGPRKRGGR